MEAVRIVVESLIRLVKAEIDPDAVLVAADDVFEVSKIPCLVLQKPTLVENNDRLESFPHFILSSFSSVTFPPDNGSDQEIPFRSAI